MLYIIYRVNVFRPRSAQLRFVRLTDDEDESIITDVTRRAFEFAHMSLLFAVENEPFVIIIRQAGRFLFYSPNVLEKWSVRTDAERIFWTGDVQELSHLNVVVAR